MNIYGCEWGTHDRAAIELDCIRRNGAWEVGGKKFGLGLFHHVREFQKLAWPYKQWHRWNEGLILPELCKGGTIAIYGAASSGKTREAADFVLTMYFAHPQGFTALCSTTDRERLGLRIWGELKMEFRSAKERIPWLPGNIVDSLFQIVTEEKSVEGRDFRDGVKGLSSKRGGEWTGLADYAGCKNDFVALVADELQLMPPNFLQGAANLKSNPRFTAIYLGNLTDLNTPLGEASEPKNGWDSLPDSETSRVYQTRYQNGRAIQLIGKDSPNMDFPEGAEPYPKLIGRRYIREMAEDYGSGSPLFDIMAGGKIPRGTMEQRVVTKAMCMKHRAFEEVTWAGDSVVKLYCADLNYTFGHGDKTVGMPVGFGKDIEGNFVLAPMGRPKVFSPMDKSLGTYEDQLAALIKAECESLDIPPNRFFFDGSGKSSFTSAIMRLWSTAVNAVEFGGPASERPNFTNRKHRDGKMANELLVCREVYDKFVSELWFAVAALIESGQARGFHEETIKEMSMRTYSITKANRYCVESKKDMKLRLGRSPDASDCLAVGVEGARRLGFPLGKIRTVTNRNGFLWLKDMAEKKRTQDASKRLVPA